MNKSVILVLLLVVSAAAAPLSADKAETPGDRASRRCSDCHEEMVADHRLSVHRNLDCMVCHPKAAEADHEKQPPVNCRQCHSVHHERIIHDAHSLVSCIACHMKNGLPTVEAQTRSIVWSGTFTAGAESRPHQLVRLEPDQGCRRCHFRDNSLGACSMVLPPKSILCMPCHAATFSLDDIVSRVSFLVFFVGTAGMCVVWFFGRMSSEASTPARGAPEDGPASGSRKDKSHSADKGDRPVDKGSFFPDERPDRCGKGRVSRALAALGSDVFLQRRLYRLSPSRWAIHGLIFFPMLVRFTFGLVALILSLSLPNWSVTTAMLDKNQPVVAFLFDLTGLMVLAGAVAAAYRNAKWEETEISQLPEPGWALSALLALIVLAGFVLEGMRIAVTGWPDGTGYAFLGYAISLLFKGVGGLAGGYGYAWYIHAILVGLFVALVPFTRMSHIVTAPLVLIANAVPAKNER